MTSNTNISDSCIATLKYKLILFHNFKINDETITKIQDFLEAQEVDESGIRVTFSLNIPDGNYVSEKIPQDDFYLNLSYGKNPREDKYSNILFVALEKQTEIRFCEFWEKHYLPTIFLAEVLEKVDLAESVEVRIFERATEWNKFRKKEVEEYRFIGQIPDEDESFIWSKPIGYITKNRVVLSLPNERLDGTSISFIFS